MNHLSSTSRRRASRAISLACLLLLPAVPSTANTVTWAVDASGAWTTPSNWSSDPSLPGPSDDVLIDRPADSYTVILPSSTQSINSLLSQENLSVFGGTLAVTNTAQVGGTLTLSGGTLGGGTWSFPAAAGKLAVTENLSTSVLRNLTLAGMVSLALSDKLIAQDGLTLSPGTLVNFSSGNSSITFAGTQTLAGSGEIAFTGGPSGGALSSTGTLTIAPGITVRTGTRNALVSLGTAGVNQGSLLSHLPAKALTVTGTDWTNTGTLSAADGGTLTLAGSWSNAGGSISVSPGSTLNLGGSFAPSGLGTLVTAPDAPAYITGTLQASADDPLTLSASSPNLILLGGTITGTINSADGSPLLVQNTPLRQNRLSAATLNAPLSLPAGVSLTAADSTIQQPVTLTGGALSLTGTWNNASSITATSGSAVVLGGAPAAIGSISLTDSTLAITSATYTLTAVQAISMTNSTLVLGNQGVLDLAGGTLTVPSPTFLSFAGGSLKGGTLAAAPGTTLQFNNAVNGKLDNVTLAADLNVTRQSGSLVVYSTLTLDHSRVSIGPGATLLFAGAAAIGSGPAVLAGNGSILFDNPSDSTPANLAPNSDGLTIESGIDISARAGTAFVGRNAFPLTNRGTITAEANGRLNLVGERLQNAGTLRATAGGVLTIYAPQGVTNTGIISCDSGSYLVFSSYSNYPAYFNGTFSVGGTLVWDYGTNDGPSLGYIRQRLLDGRSGRPTGITDPNAASDPTRAIGYAYATDLLDFGTSDLAFFNDTLGTIGRQNYILRSTRFGDANLDGTIDADDYALLDRGYAKHLTGWINGDFNYDGQITSDDYLLIDRTLFSQAQGFSPGFLSMRESQFGRQYVSALLASVPEPSLSLFAAYSLASLLPGRRRRRRRL
jgi:hypothetical protein